MTVAEKIERFLLGTPPTIGRMAELERLETRKRRLRDELEVLTARNRSLQDCVDALRGRRS